MSSRFCIHYVSKSGRLSSSHWTGKGQSSAQSPRRVVSRNVLNHQTTALISYASKVMLKILHARLQHYVNQKLPDVQVRFRKGRGTRDQIANICWIIEKAREFQRKKIYLWFINYTKAFDSVDYDKLRKALREMVKIHGRTVLKRS